MKVRKPLRWKSFYKNDFYQHPIFNYFMFAKLDAVLKRLPDHSNCIVDLGCGFGYLLLNLKSRASKVIGLDQNTKLKDEIGKPFANSADWKKAPQSIFEITRDLLDCELGDWQHQIELKEADACQTGLQDESVDAICALDVFEHVKKEQRHLCKKEVFRILKKEGKLIYTVPNTIGPAYWARVIIAFGLGKKEDPDTNDHANYHWRNDLAEWRDLFLVEEIKPFPCSLLGLEPSVIVVLKKKS